MRRSKTMRSATSKSLLTIVVLSFVLPTFGVAAGLGCAGVKPNQSTGKGGSNSSSNVDVQYYGACESAPGSGCVVTLPVAFTRMLIPACLTEDIQMTARVLSGSTPTNDSSPVNVAWAASAVTGGLYYWTVLPNQNYCP